MEAKTVVGHLKEIGFCSKLAQEIVLEIQFLVTAGKLTDRS